MYLHGRPYLSANSYDTMLMQISESHLIQLCRCRLRQGFFHLLMTKCHPFPLTPLYAGVFLISVNLTIKGLFSHVLNALNPLYSSFGFHNGAPSANSRSKFHSSAPKISLSSTYVRLRPMHPRGPVENGCAAFLISFPYRDLESAVSRKRSGMKASGFMKLDGECAAAQEATHTDI
jgi:hypothetical protein